MALILVKYIYDLGDVVGECASRQLGGESV